MFKTRLISGIILIAVALLLIIPGGPVLLAGCIAISLIGMMEFYRVIGVHKTSLAVVGYPRIVKDVFQFIVRTFLCFIIHSVGMIRSFYSHLLITYIIQQSKRIYYHRLQNVLSCRVVLP